MAARRRSASAATNDLGEPAAEAFIQDTGSTPAPEGASLDGLDAATEIEIVHPDTGQRYGVSVAAYRDLYEPQGFKPARQGDNTLLPGDPRAPEAGSIPADMPAAIVPTPDEDDDSDDSDES